jgi:dUTP pyrophosphatase
MEHLQHIKIKKISDNAIIPTQANESDAGYDLYSVEDHHIKPSERRIVKTGICISIPSGCYGRIAPRSGLAVKKGLDVLAGVIDSGYRDEVGVVLINLGSSPIDIGEGDRIAQIIFELCLSLEFVEVEDLSESERGLGGFGSSGD